MRRYEFGHPFSLLSKRFVVYKSPVAGDLEANLYEAASFVSFHKESQLIRKKRFVKFNQNTTTNPPPEGRRRDADFRPASRFAWNNPSAMI
ncbi:uncharacterized protein Dmul_31160 [Desulfococcus multivorans]|nr:uncharacterized protein Dmul_31160 [Desulfococcus multivorans]